MSMSNHKTTMQSLVLYLLSLFSLISFSSAASSWSINSGANESFTNNKGIDWLADGEPYIATGEVHKIGNTSIPIPTDLPEELKTLRAFTHVRKKQCYIFRVGKGSKILVRVGFYYGDYDQLGHPPEFEVMFDANHWVTIKTTMRDELWEEVVYVAKTYNTTICFGRKYKKDIPFVSAIEVRFLALNMYGGGEQSRALFPRWRYNYGGTHMIRYPDDIYDRQWLPASAKGYKVLQDASNILIDRNATKDMPPESVLRSAIYPNGTDTLNITNWFGKQSKQVKVHLNLYFMELVNNRTARRSFNVSMDHQMISKGENINVTLMLGQGVELSDSTRMASNTSLLKLQPTVNSTLPPLINGLEVLEIGDVFSDGTKASDVSTLSLMQQSFEALRGWTGDPCLPEGYNWEWLTCNNNTPPRIIELNLNAYGLVGPLPDFRSLDALQVIDMHDNLLSGPIPEFLANLPNLRVLNLAENEFDSIPQALWNKPNFDLNITGNKKLCNSGPYCGTSGPRESSASALMNCYRITRFMSSASAIMLAVILLIA